jgi:uncharacterized protein
MKFFSFPLIPKKRHLLLLSAFFVFGCASYQNEVAQSRTFMEEGKFDEGIEILKKKVETSNGDKLAFELEYGTLLHQAKRYKESNEIFAQAEKIADLNDYTSISKEAGSILLQEGLVQYKAESFEYILINIYQALNYIMLNDYENAQVMARKINEKLKKLEVDGDSRKRYTGFANYLAAIMWESQNDWDNAYILYKRAHELLPDVTILNRDLLKAAKYARRSDDFAKYKKEWPELAEEVAKFNPKKDGEFIFIYQQGWIPRKQPRYDNHRFPQMIPTPSAIKSLQVLVDQSGAKPQQQVTDKVFDLERVSVQTLEDDYGRLLAKKAAGLVAKAVIADQINRKNQGLGTLAFMALDAFDQADLRQWSTLPASFQLVRLPLSPGKHNISIIAEGRSEPVWSGEVEIKHGGDKHFFTLRTF